MTVIRYLEALAILQEPPEDACHNSLIALCGVAAVLQEAMR